MNKKFLIFGIGVFVLMFAPFTQVRAALKSPPNNLGLLVYWTFDDADMNWTTNKVRDASMSGNFGRLISMSTTTSPVVGKMGRGLSFDGSTQYVVNAQTVNTARVTMSIWFKKSGNPASQAWIAGFQDGLNGPSWDKDFYLATNGTVRWYVFDGSSKAVDGTTVVTDGKWHHIVGTADGTNAVLYIDGVQDGTFPVGATYTGYTVPDIFVGGTNNSGIALSQTVDEFKVYNRALSATEVARLYATRAAKQSASLPTLIPNGLVGYWTMDGKDINWATGRVADKSGTGNTAMAVSLSTTTSPVFGKVGQGLDLNGSNYLIVNSASSLNFGASTPFTMSAWIKMDPSGGSATESIMYKGDTGQNALYLFEYDISTRKLRAGVATQYTNNGCTIAGSTDVRDGKWHYVTAVYNRNASCTTNDILIYVDGVQESGSVVYSAQNADLNVSSNDSFRIGSQHEGSDTHFFDGVIDEARVYNRALSTAEVKQLYTAGVGSKSGVVPANKFASGGLVGYWSMNGKDINWSTGKATDRSGSGYDMSMISMSTSTSPAQGRVGQALQFDGSSQYLTSNGGTNTNFGTSVNFSLAAWIKMDPTGGTQQSIIFAGDEGQNILYNLYGSPVSMKLLDGFPYPSCEVQGTTVVADNKWHHVVATVLRDASCTTADFSIYVDGVAESLSLIGSAQNTNVNLASMPIDIGTYHAGIFTRFFKGLIDEVRIYNRILSASEVKSLYKKLMRIQVTETARVLHHI